MRPKASSLPELGDASNFFGRDKFIPKLQDSVRKKPLVAVISASGSGKFSLVFAGLVLKLRDLRDINLLSYFGRNYER